MSTPLQEALRDVEEGVSLRKASKVHRVPLTTLRRYRKNPTGIRPTVGRPTYLSADDEKTLEDMLIHSTNLLVGVKKSQYMKTIIECAHEKGIDTKHMGRTWYKNFLKRHPKLIEQATVAKNVKNVKRVNSDNVDHYLVLMQALKDDGYLDDSSGIYNFDFQTLKLPVVISRTVALKGKQYVHSLNSGSSPDPITPLFCGSADGSMLRPMVVFEDQMFLPKWFESLDSKIVVGRSKSGTMDAAQLMEYFLAEIIPNLKCEKNVVFFSKHCTQMYDAEMMKLCIQNGIRPVCLPVAKTPRLQPLNPSIFGALRKSYDNYMRAIPTDDAISRSSFPRHFAEVCMGANTAQDMVGGFQRSGIYTYDPEIIRNGPPVPMVREPSVVVEPGFHQDAFQKIQSILVEDIGLSRQRAQLLVESVLVPGIVEYQQS